MTDYDGPWKEALDRYFQACMAFFFPQAHTDIDWTRGYEMLDKELQKIVPAAERGRRVVDKLVKVWLQSGEQGWILIHLELQTWREGGFPKRMHVYNYRIFDRYDLEVISLAILADDDPDWRPSSYEYGRWGFRTRPSSPLSSCWTTRRRSRRWQPTPTLLPRSSWPTSRRWRPGGTQLTARPGKCGW
jgi:hypothetical protein